MPHTAPMADDRRWPQQPHFMEAAKNLMEAKGWSLDDLANELGYSPGTLHQYMYNREKRPDAFGLLVPFCALAGRDITEFIDNPAAEGGSEVGRFMAKAMGSDLSKLTDAQKQAAFDAWRAIVRGYVQ